MKKLSYFGTSSGKTSFALLILRIVAGGLMLTHGIPKLLHFSEKADSFPDPLNIGIVFSLGLAVFAEVLCSLFLILGLWTRLTLIPLIITMIVAVFIVHQGDPFSSLEKGLMFLTIYVVLFIAGSGKFSVDYLIKKKN